MHVTIAQLSTDYKDAPHYTEDHIYADNQQAFYDGVEEHEGEAFSSDVRQICDWLRPAIVASGTEQYGNRNIPWIELDTSKLAPIFEEPWKDFTEQLKRLGTATERDFRLGAAGLLDVAMRNLRESYDFDYLYVFDRDTGCQTIADWLRCLQYEGGPTICRFYIMATYDGDQ